MKRYDFYSDGQWHIIRAENPEGEVVLHKDIKPALDILQRLVDRSFGPSEIVESHWDIAEAARDYLASHR